MVWGQARVGSQESSDVVVAMVVVVVVMKMMVVIMVLVVVGGIVAEFSRGKHMVTFCQDLLGWKWFSHRGKDRLWYFFFMSHIFFSNFSDLPKNNPLLGVLKVFSSKLFSWCFPFLLQMFIEYTCAR